MDFRRGPVLVVAAHSDDETLGAGGTIWQLRQQGIDVCVAWLCYGVPFRPQDATLLRVEASNRKEACMPAAMAILGVTDHLRLANEVATRLDLVTLSEVSAKVGKLIEEVKPRVILTHWWHDVHQDHRQVWRAVEVAVRAQPPLPFVPTIATFEILSSTNYALSDSFSPTLFQTLSKRALDAKIEAMAAYTTEFNPSPHPRSVHGITTLAAYRGLQCGREYAEGFVVARMVLDAHTPSSQQSEAGTGG